MFQATTYFPMPKGIVYNPCNGNISNPGKSKVYITLLKSKLKKSILGSVTYLILGRVTYPIMGRVTYL